MSCAVQVRLCKDTKQVLLLAMELSETYKSLINSLGDSFVTFLNKVTAMDPYMSKTSLIAYQDLKLKFNGAGYNGSMHKTLVSWRQCESAAMRKTLQDIDLEFGRDCMSASYNKLWRLLQAAQKADVPNSTANEVAVDLLEHLLLALRQKRCTPKSLTIEALDRHPKTSAPGFIQVWMARLQVPDSKLQLLYCSLGVGNQQLRA